MTQNEEWIRQLIRLTPQSPLLLGNQSGIGNFQETDDSITGSALRGAVAGPLLAQCTQENYLDDHAHCPDRDACPFWQLFGADEPRFGHAYPGKFGPVWPFPLTARSCKRYPGWPTGDQKKSSHGIVDTLFADLAYGLVSDPIFPQRAALQPDLGDGWSSAWQPELRRAHDVCRHEGCGEPLKPMPGYYAWNKSPQPAGTFRRSRATHVGINRARGVAQDELLFTQESLVQPDKAFVFFAEVDVPAEKKQALNEVLLGTHYVGRGRSRGLGEVVVSLEVDSAYPSLAQRLLDFTVTASAALKPYQQKDPQVKTDLAGQLFSLTLRTPAILHEGGRPLRVPEPHHLGLPDGVLTLRGWARTEVVGGWDNAANLPRRTQMAARAGSVFLYFAPPSVDKQQLTEALARLESNGIGEELARGYGRVTVCAPFHVLMAGI